MCIVCCKARLKGRARKFCDECRPKKSPEGVRSYPKSMTAGIRTVLLAEQGGQCAACTSTLGKGQACLDHDHLTGIPRAVLCHACNASLGLLKEDPARIEALLEYAKKHKAA